MGVEDEKAKQSAEVYKGRKGRRKYDSKFRVQRTQTKIPNCPGGQMRKDGSQMQIKVGGGL